MINQKYLTCQTKTVAILEKALNAKESANSATEYLNSHNDIGNLVKDLLNGGIANIMAEAMGEDFADKAAEQSNYCNIRHGVTISDIYQFFATNPSLEDCNNVINAIQYTDMYDASDLADLSKCIADAGQILAQTAAKAATDASKANAFVETNGTTGATETAATTPDVANITVEAVGQEAVTDHGLTVTEL